MEIISLPQVYQLMESGMTVDQLYFVKEFIADSIIKQYEQTGQTTFNFSFSQGEVMFSYLSNLCSSLFGLTDEPEKLNFIEIRKALSVVLSTKYNEKHPVHALVPTMTVMTDNATKILVRFEIEPIEVEV